MKNAIEWIKVIAILFSAMWGIVAIGFAFVVCA